MLNVPLIISTQHMVLQCVCVCVCTDVCFFISAYQVVLSNCLSSWCFLFIHLRSDWYDAESMQEWKQSRSVDYLWVCLRPGVPPWCQWRKFTVSAVVWNARCVIWIADQVHEDGESTESGEGQWRKCRRRKKEGRLMSKMEKETFYLLEGTSNCMVLRKITWAWR